MTLVEQDSWAHMPGVWAGMWEGGRYGAPITVIFNSTDTVGFGPRLHTHPYPETFIIRAGRALFTFDGDEIEAVAGQILICPAGVPHKFSVFGPDRFESVNIHASGTSIIEWLE